MKSARLPIASFRPRTAGLLGAFALLTAVGNVGAQTLTWGAGGAGGSGTWSTSVANWYDGSSTVPWTDGDAAVFAGTAGTVSISGAVTASQVTFSTPGYTVQNFFLIGTNNGLTVQTDADATISSAIFGSSPYNTAFTKTGAGILSVNNSGTPVFFGSINIAAGELRYGSTFGPDGSTAHVLGNTAGAALTFGTTFAAVGSLAGGGANGGVVRPTATSGTATFTMNGVGNASYAGTFQSNGTVFTLQKSGGGTQTITGRSSLSGSAVVVNGGTLALGGTDGAFGGLSNLTVNRGGTFQLDNSAVVNQTRLDASLPVTLNGGTVSFVGNSASQDVHQTVGALNVQSGASTVGVASAGSGVSQLVFSSKGVRSTGATVDFSGGGHITVSSGNNSGILGGFATVGGTDWASVDANGNVVAYSGYATSLSAAYTQDNVRLNLSSAPATVSTSQTINSLNLTNPSGATVGALQIAAGQTLTLSSGGLLTSGNAPSRIDSGALTGGQGELIVTNQAALTIASAITDNGSAVALTKSGAGTLALTGANSYTGATYLNRGVTQVSTDGNLGKGTAVVLNGGTLQTTGSFTSTKALGGTGGTVDTAGNNVTFDPSNGNTASFTKTGAGILTLTRQNGAVTVNGGTLRLTNLVGGNNTSVTLNNGRLEAGINGLQRVTSAGGTGVALSPGQVGQAEAFVVGYLTLLGTTTVDFDLGGSPSTGNDTFSIGYNLTLTGTAGAQMLFRFNNLGNLQTGTLYSLVQLPSSQLGQFSASSFGFDPASTAAGYQGTISLTNGTVSVMFTSVPEPSTWALLGLGASVLGAVLRRRRGVARDA